LQPWDCHSTMGSETTHSRPLHEPGARLSAPRPPLAVVVSDGDDSDDESESEMRWRELMFPKKRSLGGRSKTRAKSDSSLESSLDEITAYLQPLSARPLSARCPALAHPTAVAMSTASSCPRRDSSPHTPLVGRPPTSSTTQSPSPVPRHLASLAPSWSPSGSSTSGSPTGGGCFMPAGAAALGGFPVSGARKPIGLSPASAKREELGWKLAMLEADAILRDHGHPPAPADQEGQPWDPVPTSSRRASVPALSQPPLALRPRRASMSD